MLLTFIDFMAFKEMFVEYRAVSGGRRSEQIRTEADAADADLWLCSLCFQAKEGRGLDPSQDLLVTSLNPAGSAGHQ